MLMVVRIFISLWSVLFYVYFGLYGLYFLIVYWMIFLLCCIVKDLFLFVCCFVVSIFLFVYYLVIVVMMGVGVDLCLDMCGRVLWCISYIWICGKEVWNVKEDSIVKKSFSLL